MNKLFTLIFVLGISQLMAQIEQVSVGPSYSLQAYYSLNSGEHFTLENTAWDIAFSNVGQIDGGIFINESSSFSGEPIRVFNTDITEWEKVFDFTDYVNEDALLNAEEDWSEGAFNTVKDTTNPFHYGWGAYNPSNHMITGDKVYIIQKRDGTYLKFMMISLAQGTFNFRYANLDGTNEVEGSVSKDTDSSHPYILYSFDSQSVVAFEDEFDLIFQRYSTPLDAGGGELIPYTVTGTLVSKGVEAVAAIGVDPETINHEDYLAGLNANPKEIGHGWKFFDLTTGWAIFQDIVYFVKDRNNELFKLTFIDFEGSSTGLATLKKESLGIISSTEEESQFSTKVNVYPNPVEDRLFVDIKDIRDVTIRVYTKDGRLVLNKNLNANGYIDVQNFDSGLYYVNINSSTYSESYKILVK